MDQRPYTNQKITRFLSEPMTHYHIHKSPATSPHPECERHTPSRGMVVPSAFSQHMVQRSFAALQVSNGVHRWVDDPDTRKRNEMSWNVSRLFRWTTNKLNSVALSPQANYIDGVTATCERNLVPTFVDRGVSRGQRGGSPRSLISVF
jgi:hypothetical protein